MQSNNRGKRDMQHEPTVIRTGCTSRGDLTIYADGFLKGQAVATALIGERLSALGFDGANALPQVAATSPDHGIVVWTSASSVA